MTKVAIIAGSKSDEELIAICIKYLERFNISYCSLILSAHRQPKDVIDFAENAEDKGYKVLIGIAGMAAHLSGVLAANTVLPVIGVPGGGGHLNGVDALYSTVQMPTGVPVATVAIGKAGAANAAILAAQILALNDPELKKRLVCFKNAGCPRA